MRVRTISWKEASLLGDYTIVMLGEQPYRNQAKTTFPVTKTSNFLFLVAIFCFGSYILIKQTAQTAQTECAAESAFFFFFSFGPAFISFIRRGWYQDLRPRPQANMNESSRSSYIIDASVSLSFSFSLFIYFLNHNKGIHLQARLPCLT